MFPSKNKKNWAKKQTKFFEDKFGEAKLIIGAANVICGEATWQLLIKTAFGHFNPLVNIILPTLICCGPCHYGKEANVKFCEKI